MFSFKIPKFSIFKRVQNKNKKHIEQSIQTQPLRNDFKYTKEIYTYARNRCVNALKANKPYEHVIVADIKHNKIITEYIGNDHKCNVSGIEKLVSDGNNTILLHGHPDSTPVSVTDINFLLKSKISQILAFNDKGEFSLVAKDIKPVKDVKKAYNEFCSEHYDLTEGMDCHKSYELYNSASDYTLRKHAPLMGLRYVSNYDYIVKNKSKHL